MTTRSKPQKKRGDARPPEATATDSQGDHRRQRRLENECAQFLRIQQKLAGRKTTAEYARIRLVHRQDEETRKRHLHENKAVKKSKPVVDDANPGKRSHTARAQTQEETVPTTARIRPQSARPARRETVPNQDAVAGHRVSVALLERCNYNPIPLTTRLSTSRSVPSLQPHARRSHIKEVVTTLPGRDEAHNNQHSTIPNPGQTYEITDSTGRRRIVVNVPYLEIQEDDDDERPWDLTSLTPPLGQRHERHHRNHIVPGQSAWGDAD